MNLFIDTVLTIFSSNNKGIYSSQSTLPHSSSCHFSLKLRKRRSRDELDFWSTQEMMTSCWLHARLSGSVSTLVLFFSDALLLFWYQWMLLVIIPSVVTYWIPPVSKNLLSKLEVAGNKMDQNPGLNCWPCGLGREGHRLEAISIIAKWFQIVISSNKKF
jgi:hypothetical protein